MRNIIFLSVILIALISLASCAPKVVTPRIDYKSYAMLKDSQPNCGKELQTLAEASVKSDELILDTLFCYRSVWKYWEGEYLILDTQIQSIQ